MTAPVKWFAAPDGATVDTTQYDRVAVGAKDTLAMLGDAELIRVKRTTGNSLDRSPLRIFITDPALLLDDSKHGDAIYALTSLLARWGSEVAVRVEVQW